MERKLLLIFIAFLGAKHCSSQSLDSTNLKKQNTSVLSSEDSISIFNLIDSLFQYPELLEGGSSLVARLGYNSNITASNLSLGLDQFGLSPGVTYYHKSGLYLDATVYWSQQYSPSLYLTVPSFGFLKSTKKWTLNLEYSHYFYSFSDSTYDTPYTNAVTLSNFFEAKPFLFRLDYSFYFGEKTVHRITPGIMFNFEKKNWLGMKRVLLYPTFSVLFGNESWQEYTPYSTDLAEIIKRIRNHQPIYYLKDYNKFGILNYSLSLPLSISLKNWTFLLSYTYNFPQPLPEEDLALTNSGYLSFSVIRYFNFKSHSTLIDFYKFSK
ncbi:MAG TPA: hypothetical protein VGQ59_03370 [Cyclobacteriaceae bacterium]|nr:hypothetical protein [Cyclobacteriaceae bacterium]